MSTAERRKARRFPSSEIVGPDASSAATVTASGSPPGNRTLHKVGNPWWFESNTSCRLSGVHATPQTVECTEVRARGLPPVVGATYTSLDKNPGPLMKARYLPSGEKAGDATNEAGSSILESCFSPLSTEINNIVACVSWEIRSAMARCFPSGDQLKPPPTRGFW